MHCKVSRNVTNKYRNWTDFTFAQISLKSKTSSVRIGGSVTKLPFQEIMTNLPEQPFPPPSLIGRLHFQKWDFAVALNRD